MVAQLNGIKAKEYQLFMINFESGFLPVCDYDDLDMFVDLLIKN